MLLGRSRESRELDRAVDAAATGVSAVRVLVGPPGIGKTSLLGDLVERLGSRTEDWRVLSARGHQDEGALPYAGLVSALDGVRDDLAAVPTHLRHALRCALGMEEGPAPAPFLVASATLQALAATAADAPTLLVLDDMHWLDRQSSLALLFALRRLRHEAVAALLAVREATPAAESLAGFPVLPVVGLAPAPAADLLRHTHPDLDVGVARALALRCAGNPLALLNAARVLTEDQRAGRAPLDGVGREPVHASVQQRVRGAGHAERLAALVVALEPGLGQAAAQRAIASLGLAPDALPGAVAAGLVREHADTLVAAHPLVGTTLVELAEPVERHQVHLALAGAIRAEGGADRWRPVWHEGRAVDRPSEPHARELQGLAGIARAQGDLATAARVFEQAAAITPDDATRALRLAEAGECAVVAGLPQAVELLVRCREASTDPQLRARAERLLVMQAAPLGDVATASRVAAGYDATLDRAGAALLHGMASQAAYVSSRFTEFEQHVRQALRLADGLPEQQRMLVDVCHLQYLSRRGNYDHVLAQRVAACYLEDPDPDLGRPVAESLVHADEWDLAGRVLDAVLPVARQRSQVPALTWLQIVAAELALHHGDLDRATVAAVEALTMARTIGHDAAAMQAEGVLAVVDAAAGRVADCTARTRRVAEQARSSGVGSPVFLTDLAAARLALSSGDPAAAVRLFADALRRLDDVGAVDLVVWTALPELVEAQVRARDGAAQTTMRRLMATPGASMTRTGRAWVAHCLMATGPDQGLDQAYAEACSRTDEAGDPLLAARTRLVYAERVRRARRRRDAAAAAQDALARFDAIGARLWRNRAERELAALGRQVPPPPSSLLQQLTPQERQIAEIAATGAPTREIAAAVFLSPKTVEHHLTRVYRTVGVRSKSELAALLALSSRPSP